MIIPISTAKYKVEKSVFESQLFEISHENDISTILQQIQFKHPKATHICYCAILSSEVFIKNDKEVGNPASVMYNVLYFNKFNSHLLVTIRYFGGKQLGVGGVISAFKKSAMECIEKVK